MPSGAKKRKADKKKKGKAANNHSTTNTQQVLGTGDLKTLEEKDSDGSEISSPKSQSEHPSFTENEEQGELDRQGQDSHPSASVVIADSRSMEVSQNGSGNGHTENQQKEVVEEVDVVQEIEVTGELKQEEEEEVVKEVQVMELKLDEVSHGKDDIIESVERDDGSPSGSGSSDDEKPSVDQNSQVMESGKIEEEEKGGGLVMETKPDVDSVEELKEEKMTASVMDTATEVDLAGKLEEKKSGGSVMEPKHCVDLAEPVVSVTDEVTEASASSPVVDTGVSSEIGLASKTSLPSSYKTVGALDVIEPVAKESEDKMLQPSEAPIVETSGTGSAEIPKDPAIAESLENQPLLGTVPPPVERTSWKSCCGIFDVLKGSNG